MTPSPIPDREWTQTVAGQEYLVSTKMGHFDVQFINDSFESDEMYWAKRLPEDQIRTMLAQSLTLGLYEISPSGIPAANTADSPSSPRTPSPTVAGQQHGQQSLKQIGMARFVTDHVTFAYLTDVFVHSDHRQRGLGKWLVACCGSVMEDIPALRRAMLLTSSGHAQGMYARDLGFWDVHDEVHKGLVCMTRRAYAM